MLSASGSRLPAGPSPDSLELAQRAVLRPIEDVAAEAGLRPGEIEPYGRAAAEVDLGVLDRLADGPDGRVVVVTGITPTSLGEGKTTTSIGLVQGLQRVGARAMLCLREPSVGPVFGSKGGGTGGGHAQVVPMEDINLHFTGDFHAVASAHNLLAAALDASLHHGNPLGIEPRTVTWPRALDLNDRALRHIMVGLGGRAHGVPRETGFVITAASEVMAILAMTSGVQDLRARLGRIVVGAAAAGEPVTAEDLRVAGAMAVLLRHAIRPNLVQTIEGRPALVHSGPFGNIASGNSSVLAARVGRKVADVVVTEAGFGSDLGFEKFCHLVAHIENVHAFGVPAVVAVNRVEGDADAELELVAEAARDLGAEEVAVCDGFARGGAGAEDLAKALLAALERPASFAPLNPAGMPIRDQIERIATRLYGADRVELSPAADRSLARLTVRGLDRLPVCMAKSHLSLSHDPALKGRPTGFTLPVRDVVASVGAGFVVALCGDQMLMPGLSREPAFTRMDVDSEGRVVGLS